MAIEVGLFATKFEKQILQVGTIALLLLSVGHAYGGYTLNGAYYRYQGYDLKPYLEDFIPPTSTSREWGGSLVTISGTAHYPGTATQAYGSCKIGSTWSGAYSAPAVPTPVQDEYIVGLSNIYPSWVDGHPLQSAYGFYVRKIVCTNTQRFVYQSSWSGRCVEMTPIIPPVTDPDPDKNNGYPHPCLGNPCNGGTGNKYQREVDYLDSMRLGGLSVIRSYNSSTQTTEATLSRSFGVHWRHRYDAEINQEADQQPDQRAVRCWRRSDNGGTHCPKLPVAISTSAPQTVSVLRGDGKKFQFSRVGDNWVADADVNDRLVAQTDLVGTLVGWLYFSMQSAEVEQYGPDGRLLGIVDRTGYKQTLVYSDGSTGPNGGHVLDAAGAEGGAVMPAGWLLRVEDSLGRSLRFGYDKLGRIVKVIDPGNGLHLYTYSGSTRAHHLTSVKYPDGGTRTYLYGEAANVSSTPNSGVSFAHVLTGIVDEAGDRRASWKYDAAGRAISSEHGVLGNGVDRVVLAFAAPDASGERTTAVTDTLGTTRSYRYATVHGVVKHTGVTGEPCAGCRADIGYDTNGNTSSRTDFSGHKICYEYDLERNVEMRRVEGLTASAVCTTVLATPPAPTAANPVRTISTNWHPDWRLEAQRAEPKKITTWVYNGQPDPTDGGTVANCAPTDALLPDGKPIAVLCKKIEQATTDATGAAGFNATATGSPRTWTWTYTGYGQMLTADGPRTDVSDVTTYAYYDVADSDIGKRGSLATITDALGHVTEFTAYDANGRVTSLTDPNGVYSDFTYDLRGRLTSKKVGDETTTYTYDPIGQLTALTLPDGSGLAYTYDLAHRLTAITDSLGNKVQYTLDAAGNRTKEEVRDPSGALAQTRSQVFDALGRLYKVIGAQNQTTVYAYDADGNRTQHTDPVLHATASVFDALERLIQVTDPGNGVAKLAYDGLDRITQATDPRNLATATTTDGLGNTSRQVSPDTGTTNQTQDAAGNVLTRTDARNQSTQTQYDALNRPIQVTYADGRQTRYVWDQGQNGIGRLARIEDERSGTLVSRLSYTYDPQGRLVRQTQDIGTLSFPTGYAYADGRLAALTLPSGRVLAYGYDAAGRVSDIGFTENGTARPLVQGASYAPFGRLQGWTDAAGRAQARSFDLDGQAVAFSAGGRLWNLSYDAAGRLIRVVDSADALSAADYSYDSLDRLTRALLPNASYSYGYDANGNRNSRTVGASVQAMAIAATSNRLLSLESAPPVTYAYDATGNRSADGRASYGFDAAGRLVEATSTVGTTRYEVNALNLRVSKSGPLGETRFVHDRAGRLLAEADATGTILREYVWLDGQPVAMLDGASGQTAIYAIHPDPLGTPRAVTDTSGTLRWRWGPVTEPFGLLGPEEDPDGDGSRLVLNLRFPGQYFDQETLLFYNHHRYYDAQVGGYTQSDPIGLAGGQWSTYGYVGGQPTGKVDPEGLAACPGGDWIEDAGDFGASGQFGGYLSVANVNLSCRSKPALKCEAKQVCIGGGPGVQAGAGFTLGGGVHNTPNSDGLGGWSGWGVIGAAGPVSTQSDGNLSGSTSITKGVGLGVAAIRCFTYALKCNEGCEGGKK